jgi:ferritin
MLDKKMTAALNDQITKEFYSAYLYMSMSAYFEGETLPGLAKWMRTQAQEESCHALMFFNYVCEQGGGVQLGAIKAPASSFKSPVEVLEQTLEHEKAVTASIYKLADLALELRDHATRQFLEWFIKEQVEEEASAGTMRDQLKRVADGNGLFVLDKDAGTRVFAVPVPLVGKI